MSYSLTPSFPLNKNYNAPLYNPLYNPPLRSLDYLKSAMPSLYRRIFGNSFDFNLKHNGGFRGLWFYDRLEMDPPAREHPCVPTGT